MYKDKLLLKILYLAALFLLVISFFTPRVLNGLLGLLLVIFASIVYGLKGGLFSSCWAVMLSLINILIEGYQTSIANQLLSLSVYFLIGISLGKVIDIMQEQKEKLKKNEYMHSNLAEQVPGAIYQYRYFPDGSSCFPFASAGIYDVYGVGPEEVKEDASLVFERIHEQDYQQVVKSIKKSAEELTSWQDEYRVNLADKGLRWLEGIAKPERLEDGSVLWHGHIRDITERKQMENKMEEAVQTAKAANKAKSEFLANMSHEIRTPLNAVIGFSQILEEQLKEQNHRDYLASIQKASYSLLNLINDILDMSKIEAGMLKVEFEYFDLKKLLEEMKVIFSKKISDKGLDYILVEDIIFREIRFDETRLRQILINLISNAIKFTEKGYVKVIVKEIIKDNDRLDLEIIIEDTGIGVAENKQAKIFESFTQHNGQSTREYEGTGLGLTITKKLTELLGGEIKLESSLGEGSKFKLSFSDLEFSGEKKQSSKKERLKKIEFDTAEVLVVDDIRSNRNFLKIKLGNKGLKVTGAENGKEALKLVKDREFDLIIMDLKMPVMDGYQTLEKLKNTAYDKPVIAFTASATKKEKQKVESAGFDSFITKPVTTEQLYKSIAKYLTYQIKAEAKKEEIEIDFKQIKLDKAMLNKLEKEFLVESKKIKDTIVIDELEEFIRNLYEFGDINDLKIISDYTSKLENALNSFDLEKIEEKLLEFENLIKRLKYLYERRLKDNEE